MTPHPSNKRPEPEENSVGKNESLQKGNQNLEDEYCKDKASNCAEVAQMGSCYVHGTQCVKVNTYQGPSRSLSLL